MPTHSREEVEVTSILKHILDNYPAGSAILREILQNTDDAGAQTHCRDLSLTRVSSTRTLVDPVLSVYQGPAITATNDAYFQPKDWIAIRRVVLSWEVVLPATILIWTDTISAPPASKITDNPHVLYNDTLLFLDPHQRVEAYRGGFSLLTTRPPEIERSDRDTYAGHFAPFAVILKPDDSIYQGTAIGLPLRLSGSDSKIKSTGTSIETARQMFRDFMTKELPESMLFLKHITTVVLK
ncbi:hypothetical protein M407DRAFT_32077 [Tulasnella calospora MUT 4182]|uniref:Sacsin/Nov domain-containing protein n=1 Tax=Tulasnella calospora MUT 4182 TaxID=1051891 RepID=A0A0C3Q5D7_9AGAM|nr:hypothetical protein M407DRAFT_32077 [Tulasnella calospora MUT 4182]